MKVIDGTNQRMVNVPQLNQDYALLQYLLCCHTCRHCNKALLYRAPNCTNKSRPHFSSLKHDAQTDGKCPYHEPMDNKELAFVQRSMADVYAFGRVAYLHEQQKIKEHREEASFLHEQLNKE